MAADKDRAVFSAYATERIPRTYVISRDGTIVYQCVSYEGQGLGELTVVLAAQLRGPR